MEPELMRDWALRWKEADGDLRAVRARELQEMSDEQALQAANALLDLASRVPIDTRRLHYSGLVEQQRLFHRLVQ